MARVNHLQTNFTAGELSPRLRGRVDIARYPNGAETVKNAFVLVQGGARRSYGSLYVAPVKTPAKKARLIEFVFSADDAYVLEFGDLYMRVYKDGVQVESSPGVPYEIASPFLEAQLFAVTFAQGADSMFLAHDAHPTQRLQRFGDTSWVLADAPFLVKPFDELGIMPAAALTLSAATVGAGRTFTAGAAVFLAADVGREITYLGGAAEITGYTSTTVVTCTITSAFPGTSVSSGVWTLAGTPQSTCTPSASTPVGTACTLTLGAAGWRSGTAEVGKFVRINGGIVEITGYISSTVVDGIIRRVLTSATAAPADSWTLESSVWNTACGYPRAVALHEQRLCLGGSPKFPQTIWGSGVGLYLDFTSTSADDDGFAFALSSDQVNQIEHLISATDVLVALTIGQTFSLHGSTDKAITPTNVQVKPRTNHGCARVRPLRIEQEVVFVQRARKRIRALGVDPDTGQFRAPDISMLAQHLVTAGIVDMAYQQEPDPLLWIVRSDGVMVQATFDRAENVLAMTRRTTDGAYESVCVVPTDDGEQVYAVVKRNINGADVRYVERFDPAVNVDCGKLATSGPGAATWSGLAHLQGEVVDVVADGSVMPQKTVASGAITIERNANAVEIGLHYESEITLLPVEVQGMTAQANMVRVTDVFVRLLETSGLVIGTERVPFRKFGDDLLDEPITPFTGDKRVERLGWERTGGAVTLKQDQPLPFHVLAVIRKVGIND